MGKYFKNKNFELKVIKIYIYIYIFIFFPKRNECQGNKISFVKLKFNYMYKLNIIKCLMLKCSYKLP